MNNLKPHLPPRAQWSKAPKRTIIRAVPDGDVWAESNGPGGYGEDEKQ